MSTNVSGISFHVKSYGGTSLLCLPAELRNMIWEYVLGGNIFEVHSWFSYSRGRTMTKVLNQKKNSLSLLRTCWQIYSEARLFPYRFNGFRIKNEDTIAPWLSGFEAFKLKTITEIHLVTWRAGRMLEGSSFFPNRMPDVLPLRQLPGLRRLCIEVRLQRNRARCKKAVCGICEDCDAELVQSEKELKRHVFNQNKQIKVVFTRVSFATMAALRVL